jgi:hypothetical protein
MGFIFWCDGVCELFHAKNSFRFTHYAISVTETAHYAFYGIAYRFLRFSLFTLAAKVRQ